MTSPSPARTGPATIVGAAVPRREAREKVTGAARYVDDLVLPGMIFGATVRSPVPHGRLRDVRFGAGVPWDEVTVVTARDIPAQNCIHLILDDQPCLADDVVRHREEPVVLVAHPDRAVVERARRAIELVIDPLPAVLDVDEALAARTRIWGEDNVLKAYALERGDVDAGFAAADFVVEETYETGAQEQLYIEPNGVIAEVNGESITIWGSLQCPYYVQKALMGVFGTPPERTRVIQMETGGGFGGKEEYPSILAAHAALLARKAGRPVKMIYDRSEDMAATTKRHPSRTRVRAGMTKDGKLVALDVDFLLDGGAYATLSSVVLSRGTLHAAGPYAWPNVRIKSRAVATNTPPHGAFRGFGAPQSLFALERHMDALARAAGIAPDELRRRNFLRTGDHLPSGQCIQERLDLPALLDRALTESAYAEKKARFARENAEGGPVRRGIGLAAFLHGTGFTGSGESYLASIVGVEGRADGGVRVLAASTEIGQGTTTIFAQIAAQALGIAYDDVEVAQPDTANVPNSGPTVASRTAAIVGKLVQGAATSLKETLVASGYLDKTYDRDAFREACAAYVKDRGRLRAVAEYAPPPGVRWDDATFRGDAYATYSWAVYVAEIAVDTRTFAVSVEDFVAVQEVGRVLHPVLAEGQIQGGVVQGIGWALYEHVVFKGGRMANDRMTDYIIPTSLDVPPIRVVFEERPYAHGAFGAKGIGELPMDGPAPAILNAVEDALGVRIVRVPATPEVVFDALEASLGH